MRLPLPLRGSTRLPRSPAPEIDIPPPLTRMPEPRLPTYLTLLKAPPRLRRYEGVQVLELAPYIAPPLRRFRFRLMPPPRKLIP